MPVKKKKRESTRIDFQIEADPTAESVGINAHLQMIGKSVFQQLPFYALRITSETEVADIVQAYCESHQVLQQHFDEGKTFLREICKTNVRVQRRDSYSNDARLAEIESLVGLRILTDKLPVAERLDGQLFNAPVKDVHAYLAKELLTVAERWIEEFGEAFVSLIDRTAGEITWSTNRSCDVVMNHREIRGKTKDTTATVVDDEIQTTTITTTAELETFDVQTKHSLMRAKRHAEISDLRSAAPAEAYSLWDAIPVWLKPYARVVEGDVYGKTVTESLWKRQVVRKVKSETQAVYDTDPAITLFNNIVIFLWDEMPPPPQEVREPETEYEGWNLIALAAAAVVSLAFWSTSLAAVTAAVVILWASTKFYLDSQRLPENERGL